MNVIVPKLDKAEEEELSEPLELDLIAYYKSLQDDLLEALEEHKDKPVEDIIHEVTKII